MDTRSEVRDFLTSRRARITPNQVGLVTYGGQRRVPGLRREEVAMLAGVSVDYYNRLERGNLAGVSDSVLDAVARTLRLDDAERSHLFDLAHAARPASPSRRRAASPRVRPNVELMLNSISGVPAFVRNGRFEILAANRLARALYAPVFDRPERPPNTGRFTFLDARAREFFVDWEKAAEDVVSLLRAEAGRDPYDRALTELVGELSTQSEEFRVRWAKHNVRFHDTGTKHFHHPVVGELKLNFERMELTADPGLTVLMYSADPGSRSAEGLALLASWAATPDESAAVGAIATPKEPALRDDHSER